MDIYSLMREFADSWMLLAMTAFFVACIIWAFRPGGRSAHNDSATIPFRNEDRPAPIAGQTATHPDPKAQKP